MVIAAQQPNREVVISTQQPYDQAHSFTQHPTHSIWNCCISQTTLFPLKINVLHSKSQLSCVAVFKN